MGLLLENLSNENVKVEIEKQVSKQGKVYYAFLINNNKVDFVSIPQSIYGYVRLLNNLNNDKKKDLK